MDDGFKDAPPEVELLVQDSFRRCFRDSSSWQGEAEGWPWSPSANLGRWPPPCPLSRAATTRTLEDMQPFRPLLALLRL
jgi:hypothetical protein